MTITTTEGSLIYAVSRGQLITFAYVSGASFASAIRVRCVPGTTNDRGSSFNTTVSRDCYYDTPGEAWEAEITRRKKTVRSAYQQIQNTTEHFNDCVSYLMDAQNALRALKG